MVDIIDDLLKTDCVKFGKFTLKSGEISKYYFDMKSIMSYPKLMKTIGDAMYNLIKDDHKDDLDDILK